MKKYEFEYELKVDGVVRGMPLYHCEADTLSEAVTKLLTDVQSPGSLVSYFGILEPKTADPTLLADSVIEHFDRDASKAKTRLDFARIAAGISEDRYSAGSTAAWGAIYIMLRLGVDMAMDFARDLKHHEH